MNQAANQPQATAHNTPNQTNMTHNELLLLFIVEAMNARRTNSIEYYRCIDDEELFDDAVYILVENIKKQRLKDETDKFEGSNAQ